MTRLKPGKPATYRITIQGTLNSSWSRAFNDMNITNEHSADGVPFSVLTGQLVDQGALLGVLDHLHGLGFSLLRVECVEISSAA
jgi:hypothetical protein